MISKQGFALFGIFLSTIRDLLTFYKFNMFSSFIVIGVFFWFLVFVPFLDPQIVPTLAIGNPPDWLLCLFWHDSITFECWLAFFKTSYSRLIFYILCPRPETSHLPQAVLLLFVDNGIEKLKSGYWEYSALRALLKNIFSTWLSMFNLRLASAIGFDKCTSYTLIPTCVAIT